MKNIVCPLFLFEHIVRDAKELGSFQGFYKTIAAVENDLEGWQVNKNIFKIFDAKGRLLTLSNISGSVKVNINQNASNYTELLQHFLKQELQYSLLNIKQQGHQLKVAQGCFWKTRRIIDDKSISINLADNSFIRIDFLRMAIYDFVKKFFKPDIVNIRDDLTLQELVDLASILWVYDGE